MMVQKHKKHHRTNQTKKVRIVDFGDTLAEILKNARKEQLNRMQYGELYHKNYYREVKDKNRVYYEYYHLDGTEEIPVDYKEISFVCLRPDGCLELPSTPELFADCCRNWTDLKNFIFTSCDTPTQATFSQTELPEKDAGTVRTL